MSVSIRDVAAQAEVSLATVSKVLNDRVGSRIAPATDERVRRAARELGYQPNRFARGMAQKRTQTLGLMISGLQNPFFLSILEEAERRAIEAGYQVMLDAAPSVDGTYRRHGKLSGWPVDGVLMWAEPDQNLALFLGPQAQDLPVVYLGYPRADSSDWAAFDLYEGGRQAAEYLIAHGHRRIAYVDPWATSRKRLMGNQQAALDVCLQAGLKLEIIPTVRREETRRAALETGLALAARPAQSRPEALLCHNDVVAIGLYHGLRRAGLRVPEDIAIIGFDGIEEGQCLDVPLTTVHIPIDRLCAHAVNILMARLNGIGDDLPQQITLPSRLLPGGTA